MKWLAIFLLVLNIAYFTWQLNQRIDDAASSANANESGDMASDVKLVLLSELNSLPPLINGENATPGQNRPEISESQIKFKENGTCFTFGPFISNQERTDIWRRLSSQQVTVREREEEQKMGERYWVYLAARPSTKETQAQLQALKSKGVEDYYMIRTGDMKNAISLGLFNTQLSVSRRLQELNKKGYNPIVIPQHKTSLVYWLDAQIDQPLQAVEIDKIIPNLPEGINVIDRECSEIALLH